MFRPLLKKIIPATFSKIDTSVGALLEQIENQQKQIEFLQDLIEQRFLELKQTIENESNWKRTDIVNDLRPILAELKQTVENESNWKRNDIVNDLRSILTELKQTIENESNWKRTDIVNDLRPIIAELKQTVENESNWKIADTRKFFDESCYRIKNIEKIILEDYWKKSGTNDSLIEFGKHNYIYFPKAICNLMVQKNMTFEEIMHFFSWNQGNISYEELDYLWQYLLENSNTDYWILFEHYVRFVFSHGDLQEKLCSIYESNIAEFERWTKITQLSYISFLLYKNEENEAKQFLEKYIAINEYELVEYFIPVSHLAQKYFDCQKIEVCKNAKIYEIILHNKDLFNDMIKEKKIALVGNGPQENGKFSGEKIDSHDIVIRFNAYSISEEFRNDYGKKVDIWANCMPIPNDFSEKGNFSSFMYLPGIFDEPLYNRFIDISEFSYVFTFDVLKIKKEVYKKTGLYCASNGVLLIYAIKQICKDFNAGNCFGFSFKEKKTPQTWLHYDSETPVETYHSLSEEKIAILKLLEE